MPQRLVILGGGTGGTIMANRLRKHYGADELTITVVDRDDTHVYQPGLLFVPFGHVHVGDIVRPRHRQLHQGPGVRHCDEHSTHTAHTHTHNT